MTIRRLAKAIACIGISASVFVSGAAFADDRTEARTHFKKGMAAIADGRYETGIEELKAAYDIRPHPNVLYNIARAYVDTGDLPNAVVFYRRYLESAPNDQEEVKQLVMALEERVRKQEALIIEASTAAVEPSQTASAPSAPAATGETVPAAPTGAVAGHAASSTNGLKTEEVFEETVVTASRSAQSPLDAPNSTSIITEQDIRLSGIIKIPELLRRLAGVDIMETTGSQTEVSLRGFNARLSSRVLVLIDGRSVFVDLVGATFWAALPVGVEDIQRIEIVRGPGSALYGADAFNGVVNIITKAPGTGDSGVNVGFGDHDTTHGAVWATGRANDLAYRISAGYDYVPRWSREVPPGRDDLLLYVPDQNSSGRVVHIDTTATQALGKNVTVGVDGNFVQSNGGEILGIGAVGDQVLTDQQTSAAVWVKAPNFEARVYGNYYHGDEGSNASYIGQTLLPARYEQGIMDAEAQFIAKGDTGSGISHELHIGGEYRLKPVHWSYLENDEVENHFGLFVHDEIQLGSKFAVVGDYRADYVPYLAKIVQSPRASLLFHPSAKSTLRGIVATAFRTPNFLESYLNVPGVTPISGGYILAQSHPAGQADFRIQPEHVFTTEFGFLDSESDYFTFDSALFYNHVNDLIELGPTQTVTLGGVNNPAVATQYDNGVGGYPIFYENFQNQCQVYDVYGAELGARVYPVPGVDLFANYTLMDIKQDNSGCNAAQIALIGQNNDARTSASKLNAGMQVRSKSGLNGEAVVSYASPQNWAEQVTDPQKQQIDYQSFHVDPYAIVNTRVGYRFYGGHAEVSGVAFNLFNDQHREHPFGQNVGRRVMAFFSYRF